MTPGLIDRPDRRHDGFTVFPGDEGKAVSDQVNDAGLNQRLRKHRRDRLRKALQAIDDRDQNVVDAPNFQLVHDLEPELRAFGLFDPQAQNLFLAIGIESERDIDRLVFNEALIADLDPQGVEENDRVDGIERPVLPLAHLVQDGIGDPADEIGRDVDAVKLGQMAPDLAHRHAAGVQAQDLVVEPVEPGLAFGDKLRLESCE